MPLFGGALAEPVSLPQGFAAFLGVRIVLDWDSHNTAGTDHCNLAESDKARVRGSFVACNVRMEDGSSLEHHASAWVAQEQFLEDLGFEKQDEERLDLVPHKRLGSANAVASWTGGLASVLDKAFVREKMSRLQSSPDYSCRVRDLDLHNRHEVHNPGSYVLQHLQRRYAESGRKYDGYECSAVPSLAMIEHQQTASLITVSRPDHCMNRNGIHTLSVSDGQEQYQSLGHCFDLAGAPAAAVLH